MINLIKQLPHPEDASSVTLSAESGLYQMLIGVRYWMADKTPIEITVPDTISGLAGVEHHAEYLCDEFDYSTVRIDHTKQKVTINLIP